jgi:hypothetical protein
MPRLSSLYIRASLLYLAAGFTLGGLLLANKGLAFDPRLWGWLPSHIEYLLIGWIVQLAMGVGYWILPRLGQESPRGSERPVWAAFFLLNLGLWLVSLASLLGKPELALIGRFAETGAGALFVLSMWKRVKPFMG